MNTNNVNNSALSNFATKILIKRENSFYNASLKQESINFLKELIDLFFPQCSGKTYYDEDDVLSKIKLLERDLIKILKQLNGNIKFDINQTVHNFSLNLPKIHDELWADAEFIYQGDPAAECIDEIILAYPGFTAIVIYRISNLLYKNNIPIIPRILTEYAHQMTGVDIHPGADIKSPFFIDHGTGIVIGETSVIGKNVKIYQGVTLGALSVDKSLANTKRHPTIEDNTIIYAQAVILGGNTTIGQDSIIGGNSWVTQSVEPFSIVYNKSEVRVRTLKEIEEPINFII